MTLPDSHIPGEGDLEVVSGLPRGRATGPCSLLGRPWGRGQKWLKATGRLRRWASDSGNVPCVLPEAAKLKNKKSFPTSPKVN